ncbi:MAG: DUF6788 family protein [Methanosarcinaceae archaeon]
MSSRQQLYLLQKKRNDLVWELLNSLPVDMIAGSFLSVYKTCSTPNCKCKKGQKHGPYPAIQFKSKGKYTIKMLKSNDVQEVEIKLEAYRQYQTRLAETNKLNTQITKLLQQLRDENLEEYP